MAEQQGSRIVLAMKRETTYGTAIQAGANDGLHFESHDFAPEFDWVDDEMKDGASVMQRKPRLGMKKFMQRYSGEWRYDGVCAAVLANMFALDAVTEIAAGVGATHKLTFQPNNNTEGLTAARWLRDLGTPRVEELIGGKVQRVNFSIDAGKPLKVTIDVVFQNLIDNLIGSPTNTTASMANVTAKLPLDALMYNDMVVHLADEDGAAFDNDDKVVADHIDWSYERPYKLVQAGESLLIREPVANGWFPSQVNMRFPSVDNAELGRRDDLLANTSKRLRIGFTGPLLTGGAGGQDHAARFFFPQLVTRQAPFEIGSDEAAVIQANFTAHKTDTAPNDMDGELVPLIELDTEVETNYLP
jgi:hypothetical protein